MKKYIQNNVLIITMVSMMLIISSNIVNNATIEVWLLISGWIVLIVAIVMYVLKIKKEDEDNIKN